MLFRVRMRVNSLVFMQHRFLNTMLGIKQTNFLFVFGLSSFIRRLFHLMLRFFHSYSILHTSENYLPFSKEAIVKFAT